MANTVTLEICVASAGHAIAAERAGAHRIELCRDLSCGGLTPSAESMQAARRQLRIPIHVLIRPRPGNFCYSDDELDRMRADILAARQFGMDAIVLGVLRKDSRVDIARTKSLVELARPLPVTFHRAFDVSENFETSLEDVLQTGATRILTSAGQPRATDALSTLARLVQSAQGRILLMPCGGINSNNILRVVQATQAQEIHSSAGASNHVSADHASSDHVSADHPSANHASSNRTSSSHPDSRSIPVANAPQLHSRAFEQNVAEMVNLLNVYRTAKE